MLRLAEQPNRDTGRLTLAEMVAREPVLAFAGEPLRVVVYRMVESGFTRLPVVESADNKRLAGMVSLEDLLRARGRHLEEEHTRERVLKLRVPLIREMPVS